MNLALSSFLSGLLAEKVFDGLTWAVVWRARSGPLQLNRAAMELLGTGQRELSLDEWWSHFSLPDGRPLLALGLVPRGAGLSLLARPTHLRLMREDGVSVEVRGRSCQLEGWVAEEGEAALLEEITTCETSGTTQWLSTLAHEARGALQSLSLATTMAQTAVDSGPQAASKYLHMVRHHAEFIKRLVCDYLDAASNGALPFRLRVVPLASILEGPDWSNVLGSRHNLLLSGDAGLSVLADPDRLRQILTNLLINARKYAKPGPVLLATRRAGARVLLSLRDEGPGIADADRERIFGRTARLSHNEPGRGLGLWLSRELARQMGGDLWVSSTIGGPTTFYVSLQHACEAPPELEPKNKTPGVSSGGRVWS